MDKLQAHAEKMAKRALDRRGWGAVKGDDNNTSVPSRCARTQLGFWTIGSTLRHRRLSWFHSMSSQQFHHDTVWAVLFGKYECESVEDIDELGHPAEKALPYVKQLASDLQVADCFQGFQAEWTTEVDVEQFETVLKRDRERVKTRDVSEPEGRVVPNDRLFIEDIDGGEHRCECGKGFMGQKALQLHQVKEHQKVDMRTGHIVGNQCPRCTMPLSSIPITQKPWLADICGHSSTQKGPSPVNTAAIKIAQTRLKRAIELGIELVPCCAELSQCSSPAP